MERLSGTSNRGRFTRLGGINNSFVFIAESIVILSLILGYLSWKYIEIPFRDKISVSIKKFFFVSASISVFLVSIGIYGHLSNGILNRLPTNSAPFILAIKDINPRRVECHFGAKNFPKSEDSCVLGRFNNLQGALLGDSHADSISYELEKELELKEMGFLSLTYSGCAPVQNIYRVDANLDNKCYEFNMQTFKYLQENPKIHYVILSARWALYLEKNGFNNNEGGIENTADAYIDVVVDGEKKINEERNRRRLVSESYTAAIENLLKIGKRL